MKFSQSVLLTTLATTLSLPVISEEQSPIVVTATRTAQTVDNSLASVSVITSKDIERMQATSLVDVLEQTMSIDFVENGSYGKNTQLYLRGTNKEHVLVLIDGAKAGSMTTGEIRYGGIPISQIDRIEVVRGPRSSLYGSNAIGGVIQIFTKKGSTENKANFKVGVGSEDTSLIQAGYSGGKNNTTYSVQVEKTKTSGINVREDKNTDDDGFSNTSVSANINHKLSQTAVLDMNIMQADGTNEYDGSPYSSDFFDDFLQQSFNTSLDLIVNNKWSTKFIISQFNDKRQIFKNDVKSSRYNTERREYIWQNDITINKDNLITFGLNHQKEELDSSVTYNETSRTSDSVFTQYQWLSDSQSLTLGVRSDDYSEYGQQNSSNIAWGINFNKNYRLHAAYATAFKAPTFNQQYNPSSGNVDIKPETATSKEIGVTRRLDKGEWQVNIFQTDVIDLMSYNSGTKQYENVDKARIEGIESSIKTIIAKWRTQASFSILSPRNTKTDKLLRRRAEHHASISLDRNFDRLGFGGTASYKSERYNSAGESSMLDGYTVLNLRSSYKLNKKWSLNAKIDNVMDTNYQTLKNYSLAGRTYFVSVSYSE